MTALSPALLAPIAGDNPAGQNLEYGKVYLDLEAARREDDGMPQGDWQTARKTADWSLIVRIASDALTKQTKDLQIAVWLTEAWLRQEGFGGFLRGLTLIQELLDRFWPSLYPPIDDDGDMIARIRPIGWMTLTFDVGIRLAPLNADGHSLLTFREAKEVPSQQDAASNSDKAKARENAVRDGRATPEDVDAAYRRTGKEWFRTLVADIDASIAALDALDAFCVERLKDEAPNFSQLRTVVEEARHAANQLLARKLVDEPDPQPSIVEETIATEQTTAGGASDATPSLTQGANLSTGPRNRDEASQWVAVAARRMREEAPTDPAPYLVLRALRWGELRSNGGRIDERMLVAPPTDVRTRLKTMMLDAQWPQLLSAAEDVMAQPYSRGWLDLQRYTLTAADALGPEYEAVGTSVRGALRSLLADLPALTSASLMDDSPAANADTRAWLRDENLLPSGDDVPVPCRSRVQSAASRRDAYDIAQAMARAGDANGAMTVLMRAATQEKSARARFLRRAQAADVMVNASMEGVALPILRELLTLIETHRLEDWEQGDTVAQPLALLYRCAKRLNNNDVDARALYDRICRLDPISAVQLQNVGSANEGS